MLMAKSSITKDAVVGRNSVYQRSSDNYQAAIWAHPGKYVAVDENGVIAIGKSFTSVSKAAHKKKKGRFFIGTAPMEEFHGIASL